MGFVQDGGWVIDFSMAGEGQNGEYLWPPQVVRDHPNSSGVGVDRSCKEVYHNEKSSSKKRGHDEVGTEPRSKACREKLRRDRLNDRFLELCSVLDPGGTPKSDKVAILSDAARALNHLRAEAQKLKDANAILRESIMNLKAEKVELREEKVRLKAEKERIEHAIKSTSMPSTFVPHPASAYHAAALAENTKAVVYPNYSPVAMWQWIPPAVLDTSHDHVLRPPVA
ncbi:transcription factor ILR3-like [Nymphaea colorata]|nr:transcription factor ILR3-like [Nymphaea colorata]